MPRVTSPAPGLVLLLALAALAPAARVNALSLVPGSVRLPAPGGLAIGASRIVRTALTQAELSEPMAFSVSLRVRDLAGLRARVGAGERLARAELESRYLPLSADYARVAAWLGGEGFTQTLADRSHTTVFVTGTVAQIARVFGVRFARVAASDGEYTSAVSEPSVPDTLAPVVLSVNGLQPQLRLRHTRGPAPGPEDLEGKYPFVTPDNVAAAYNIPPALTGAGQTIAIVGEAPVLASDLVSFWSTTGVPQVISNLTTVEIPGAPPSSNPGSSATLESNLDVEWASSIAPASRIRFYLSSNVFYSITQIENDASDDPTMTVLSISFGLTEGSEGDAILQAYSQVFATMAAGGMTIVAGSGDSGSNPNPAAGIGANNYLATAPLAVTYPASDPSVTGVGGTTVRFTGSWSYSGETVWNDLAAGSATGGGVSSYFPRPPWQTGGGVLAAETMRCVPDVAAIAFSDLVNVNLGPNFDLYSANEIGVYLYVNGSGDTGGGGTSLAVPVWAAVVALANQARASGGLGPLGLLNPHLYPLQGTAAFNDITSGTNGAYSAGPGYDLCTGLGSPDVSNLITALGGVVPGSHRLVNVSARADVETGANIVIAGFVIGGGAGTTKQVLVRGVGPALAALGVAGELLKPVVSVFDSSSAMIASDTGWGGAPVAGPSTVGATYRQATAADMVAVGAFALQTGSDDSAMVLTLPVGSYTVQVSGVGGSSGIALSEVYELSTSVPESLENLSARCLVGTGGQVAISGFVVTGSQNAQLLVRGIGPALGAFGLTGVLAQPTISLYDSTNTLIASNRGWGNLPVAGNSTIKASYTQASAAQMAAVGAFALDAASADSAMVVTVPPGSYTAIVSGENGGTGTALAEIYQINGP